MLKKIFLVAILSCAISYVYAQGEAKLQDYYCVVFGSTPLKSQTNLKIIWGDDNSAKTLLDETGNDPAYLVYSLIHIEFTTQVKCTNIGIEQV